MSKEFARQDGDGFRVARPVAGGRAVLNVTHWSTELDSLLRDIGDVHVVQQAAWLDGTAVLPQLARYVPKIRALTLGTQDAGDLAILNDFTQLEALTLGQPADAMDFRRLPRLRAVSLNPGATLAGVAQAPAIESLNLWSIPIRDLSVLSPLHGLRKLALRQIVALKSLNGIASLPLEHLVLSHTSRLESVAPLREMQQLRHLQIDGASKATGGDAIGDLAALEALELDNGPALPTLEGFGRMASLQSMRVLNTPIGDGPCSVSPLSHASTLWQLHLCGEKRSLENLVDLDRLGALVNLRRLALDRVGDVPSLAWIRPLVRLETFALGGARLVDGDVSPLFGLPNLVYLDMTARGIARASPEYQELKRRISARGQRHGEGQP